MSASLPVDGPAASPLPVDSSARPPALEALTGLRFLAALHVVFFHYAGDALAGAPGVLRALVATGPAAVSLFYVLSGVVLTYSSTGADGALRTTTKTFWRARFARIYPIYFVALLIDAPFLFAVLLKGHGVGEALGLFAWQALPAVLLVQALLPSAALTLNAPGWSVSCEAFFYAAFPRLVGRLRWTGEAAFWRRSVGLWLLALVPPVAVTLLDDTGGAWLTSPVAMLGNLEGREVMHRIAGFSPLFRIAEFLLGIALGHRLSARARGVRENPPRSRDVAWEAVSVVAVVGSLVALGIAGVAHVWLDSGLLAPVFALLIAALSRGRGPLAWALCRPIMVTLGNASYPLYILQDPVQSWFHHAFPAGGATGFWVFLAIVLSASLLGHHFVAEPARKALGARWASTKG